jgi:methanogenic corrinoid protein MtbC1
MQPMHDFSSLHNAMFKGNMAAAVAAPHKLIDKGAPVTNDVAKITGADGCADNAPASVELANRLSAI